MKIVTQGSEEQTKKDWSREDKKKKGVFWESQTAGKYQDNVQWIFWGNQTAGKYQDTVKRRQ